MRISLVDYVRRQSHLEGEQLRYHASFMAALRGKGEKGQPAEWGGREGGGGHGSVTHLVVVASPHPPLPPSPS